MEYRDRAPHLPFGHDATVDAGLLGVRDLAGMPATKSGKYYFMRGRAVVLPRPFVGDLVEEGWLPFVDTYRTLCLAPPQEIVRLFTDLRGIALAG